MIDERVNLWRMGGIKDFWPLPYLTLRLHINYTAKPGTHYANYTRLEIVSVKIDGNEIADQMPGEFLENEYLNYCHKDFKHRQTLKECEPITHE